MLADQEPELYSQAIERTGGNITKAAEWLGITSLKNAREAAEFGIDPKRTAEDD